VFYFLIDPGGRWRLSLNLPDGMTMFVPVQHVAAPYALAGGKSNDGIPG
jgi:hypothetical protein